MQQQEGFKKFLPHLMVIAIFIFLSCAFCYPSFQGMVLDQHDIKTWLWGSKEGRDYYTQTGENALWANNMFGGMPQALVTALPKNNWYDNLAHIITLSSRGGTSNPAVFFFIAMVSFYVLMMALRVNKWLGAIGAIAFAFSTYNPTIITAGHTTKMLDIAYIPGVLAGIIIAYRGKYLAGAALTGLFLALSFNAGHWQIVYYSLFLIGAMVLAMLVTAIREKQLKKWLLASGILIVAGAFAALTSASGLLQTEEYSTYSIRGGKGELTSDKKEKSTGLDRDYAFTWSNGAGEVFSILVPNIYGGSVKENIGEDSHFGQKLTELGASPDAVTQMTTRAPLYWGPQPILSGSVYYGAVICLLFVLSLFIIRSPYKWWLAGAALLLIFISMGKNFSALNYFLFNHFPYFNKFRSPNMALAIPSLVFSMLAIWALKDIFEEKITKEELWKKLKLSVIITGGICVIILIGTQSFFDYKGMRDEQMIQQYGEAGNAMVKALREDRASAAATDAFRSLIFILLAGGVLWAYSKNKLNKTISIAAIGLLVVIDILPVGHRWLNSNDYLDEDVYMAENFQPSAADQQILQDKDPYYRVLDLSTDPFNDSKPSYFHKAIGGYHGAKLQIYQDLIENQLGRLNASVLNMLNTKYIIVPGQNNQPFPQQNPGALGNAWFVSEVKWVNSADEEMKALNAPAINNPGDSTAGNFNPATTAVIRNNYKDALGNYTFGKDSSAYIRLAPNGYSPLRLKFESNNSQNGLAVFSDIYYPIGWKATIDGKEVPIVRVDYVLRGLKIPAGKHTIEFSFHSKAYEKGSTLALVGSVLLTLLIGAGLYTTFAKKKEGLSVEDEK